MKLFELSEAVESNVPQGICIFPDQDPPGIELGPEREKVIPLAPCHLRKLRDALKKDLIQADVGIRLIRADITAIDEAKSAFKLLRESSAGDNRALVNVRVPTGLSGTIRFTANSYDEELRQGRVERVYRSFDAAIGITIVMSVDTGPWPDMLLTMEPGASFRILRTGDLDGRPPEMIVTWNGFKLRTIVPARYKHNIEHRETA